MGSRDTTTGGVLESMIIPSLKKGGYSIQTQVNIGDRVTKKRHIGDVIAQDINDRKLLVSLKWQQISGTAEQKVPFEVICLVDAIKRYSALYTRAYLVLGGEGWSLRDFYINELDLYLPHRTYLTIMKFETFIAEANRGRL